MSGGDVKWWRAGETLTEFEEEALWWSSERLDSLIRFLAGL